MVVKKNILIIFLYYYEIIFLKINNVEKSFSPGDFLLLNQRQLLVNKNLPFEASKISALEKECKICSSKNLLINLSFWYILNSYKTSIFFLFFILMFPCLTIL